MVHENDFNPLNKRNIKERMAKNGIDCVKVHGIFVYTNLEEKKINFYEMTEDEKKDEQIPVEFL